MQIPAELEAAFASDESARRLFEKLPPSHQMEYVKWIEGAVKEATRIKRANDACARLSGSV